MAVEEEERMGRRQILNPVSTLFTRVRNVIFVIQIVNVLLFSPFSFLWQYFWDNTGLWALGRIGNETAIGSENREVHLSGPFIRLGLVHCYRLGVQRGLTVWSGGSTNAFIILMVMTMSIIIFNTLAQ